MVDVHKKKCRLGVPVTARVSKEGCTSLAARGRLSFVARKHD